MKKSIHIIIAALAALLTACNGETFSDDNFRITVSSIKDREAKVRIVPADTKAYYVWDIETEEWFQEHKDSLGEYYKHQWDEAIKNGWYEPEGEEETEEGDDEEEPETSSLTFGDGITEEYFMYKGIETEEIDALQPGTEYAVFAFYPDENYHASRLTVLTFKTAEAEMVKDMRIWFMPDNKDNTLSISLSLIGYDELFYGSVPTHELGSMPVKDYAEQYFADNIASAKTLKPDGLFYMTKENIPETETEWFACTFIGKTRTSEWFFYHTPAK